MKKLNMLDRLFAKKIVETENRLNPNLKEFVAKIEENLDIVATYESEQAASIHESVASLAEMKSMLQQTAEHVIKTEHSAESSFRESEKGRSIIAELTNAMDRAHQALESANESMESLNRETNSQLKGIVESIKKIEQKADIINDIVVKTQLLSFNAAIEAAQAGKYGQGFAVVAKEVGHLAQMSGAAAAEIEDLITESESRVVETVDKVKDHLNKSADKLNNGRSCFSEAKNSTILLESTIENMTEQMFQVKQRADASRVATDEQLIGMGQISCAISEIDKNSQAGIVTLRACKSELKAFNTAMESQIPVQIGSSSKKPKPTLKVIKNKRSKNAPSMEDLLLKLEHNKSQKVSSVISSDDKRLSVSPENKMFQG